MPLSATQRHTLPSSVAVRRNVFSSDQSKSHMVWRAFAVAVAATAPA